MRAWLLVVLAGCAGGEAPSATGPLDVRTTSFPVHWATTRILGDLGTATLVLPAGEDPVRWTPPGEVVATMASADLIVANGAGYEGWMATASLPTSRVVHTADQLDLIRQESQTHSHGPRGTHSHAGLDPHTFGDPTLFGEQVRSIGAGIVRVRPEAETAVTERVEALVAQLDAVQARYASALAGKPTALSSHPAYAYLARRHGFEVHAFDFDPAVPPDEAQLASFAEAAAEGALLWWEEVPSKAVTSAFPDGVRHVFVDPLEQPPSDRPYDYLRQAASNATVLGALYGTSAGR